MGERDVATETGEGLVSVIKAEDRRTHTHAGHGLTNHSVPHHLCLLCTFLRVGHQGSSPTDYHWDRWPNYGYQKECFLRIHS